MDSLSLPFVLGCIALGLLIWTLIALPFGVVVGKVIKGAKVEPIDRMRAERQADAASFREWAEKREQRVARAQARHADRRGRVA